jgi:DNA mismatch repair protein MutS
VTPGTLTEDSLLDARRHNFGSYANVRWRRGIGVGRHFNRCFSVLAVTGQGLDRNWRAEPKRMLLSDVGEADFGTIVEDSSAAVTVLYDVRHAKR